MARKKHKDQKTAGGQTAGLKRWTNWTAGDFALQLATVIIGILVTFGGSSLIQKRAERRDTAYILSMVKDELQKNISQLEQCKERLIFEYEAAKAMKPYMNAPELMPRDSLNKYITAIVNTRHFSYMTNSFEVLKSSSQVQSVRNKDLLRDLFSIYEAMNTYRNSILSYIALQEKGIEQVISVMDSDKYDAVMTNGDPVVIFADMMTNPVVRNFIVSTANGNNRFLIPRADELAAEITRIIGLIDGENHEKE
jgi:hypothetical protein